MDHRDHVNLIRPGVVGTVWGDFGAGSGAFTLALSEILGPGGEIHAVDRDSGALKANRREMHRRFPAVSVQYHEQDFTQAMDLPPLDGIVMANSLHFQRDHSTALEHVKRFLSPGGRIVVVEYNIEDANFAVPHPVPYRLWESLASGSGLRHTELMMRRPSRFLREIYSAVSW
jgi:ubiquinone/menaquinone biosynthesis C-methylase UbiE